MQKQFIRSFNNFSIFKIKFKYMNNEQVKLGFKHFFDKDISDEIANIKGLTAGDFATVKKKVSFR